MRMTKLAGSSILPLGITSAVIFGASHTGDGVQYIDLSIGLEQPGMEAGNTEIEFADVDGDGNVDLVSIGDHGSPFINTDEHGVMVWFGDGTGNWSLVQNGNFGYGGCALGDVNNDGLMDIGYGMHHDYSSNDLGDQLLEVALGDGTGINWTPWDDGLATNGETWGMFGTDFADVDNDGDLDIGSISFGCCAGVHVYRNNGDGTWTQTFGFLGGNAAVIFEFADFNGDGNADFATSHDDGTVYFGDGTGDFSLADGNLPEESWRRGVSVGDVNADGRDDLAFRTASGVRITTFVEDGVWDDLSGTLASIGSFSFTQIADMNLDGAGDVLVFRDEALRVYAGDNTGQWELVADVPLPAACDDAAFRAGVDADHNGFPDIVIIQEEDCGQFTGGANRPRFFAESSTPDDAFVFPAFPRGGEVFRAGSIRFIDWHAGVPDDAGQPMMSIDFSISGKNGPWLMIADHVPDNGRFQWRVPVNTSETNDAAFRYRLHTDSETVAITPEPFSITGTTSLVDLTAVEGELIDGGLLELLASDDAVVQARSEPGFTAFEPNLVDAVIGFQTDVEAPQSINTSIESSINNPSGTLKLRLKNWESDTFEEVEAFEIGFDEQTDSATVENPADFVREADGRIEVSARYIVASTLTAQGFDSFIDRVGVVVE